MGYAIIDKIDNPNGNGFEIFSNPSFLVQDVPLFAYIAQKTDEGRPHLIAYKIWGDELLLPELMKLNGILNPYAVKANQLLFVCSQSDINKAIQSPDILKTIVTTGQKRNAPLRQRPDYIASNSNSPVDRSLDNAPTKIGTKNSNFLNNVPKSNSNVSTSSNVNSTIITRSLSPSTARWLDGETIIPPNAPLTSEAPIQVSGGIVTFN